MHSVEWDIRRNDFEGQEECFISQSSGWEQTFTTHKGFLVSYTRLGVFRTAIACSPCFFGTVVQRVYIEGETGTKHRILRIFFLDGPARKNSVYADEDVWFGSNIC